MSGHMLSQMIARCLLGCQTILCVAISVTLLSTTTPALAVGRPRLVYVANSRSNSLSIYEMNAATGDLVLRGEVAAGRSPVALAVHLSGLLFCALNKHSYNVSLYAMNPTTGLLTLLKNVQTGATLPTSKSIPTADLPM
jgi:hypothetical protein